MSEEWQTPAFRQNVVSKINEAIAASNMPPNRNGNEMESHVFSKARTKEEYLGFVAKIIIHVRDAKNKQQQQQHQQQQQQQQQNPDGPVPAAGGGPGGPGGMQDPINALQNLASQGTRNPMQSQMMGLGGQMNPMGGPGPQPGGPGNNSNVLQSLIHQRPGQQQMPNMANMQGIRPPGGKQMPGNLQQGNMPPGGMVNAGMGMGMGPMGNQIPNAAGQIGPGNMPGQMNQMGGQMQMNNLNVPNQQMNPMNNMVPISINPGMNQNQMQQVGINSQMNQSQMNQLLGRINVGGPGGGPGGMNHQVGSGMPQQMGQMNPNNMPQINPNGPGGVGVGMNQPQQTQQQQQQMGGPGVGGVGAGVGGGVGGVVGGVGGPNAMNQQMPINQPPNIGQNQIGGNAGQMNLSQMLNMQQHMGRKQDMMMANSPNMYQVRGVVPPSPYFRKSPSPSAPSPANLGQMHQGQMVPSPALVPSPQMPGMMPQQRNVMAQSPSSSINTPGQVGAVPSPINPHEEQQYREKYRQLTKYIDPLKRMIGRIGCDGKDSNEKLLKMNKLLEILCNPNKRIPLETLLKCEIALEKMDFKSYSFGSANQFGTLKEHQANNPLLEAVNANLQSPIGNHTLQRTFRPCLEALFGPDIKNLPPPSKMTKISYDDVSSTTGQEIPHILQGEIARLDQKFKISLDPSSQIGTKIIKLVCCLDDKHLPCVPPVSVAIPDDYPSTPPSCKLISQEYSATPFLMTVQDALTARISRLPKQFSLSHLLDTWEMSVRQACSPSIVNPTTTSVILGI